MTLAQIKLEVLAGRLSRDAAWDIGMDHPDWDIGAEIRCFIIDLNEQDEKCL